MTKQEFEERIGKEVSNKDYAIIENVYVWHPSIKYDCGKDQIAELYKIGGMPFINSMIEATNIMQELEQERVRAKEKLDMICCRIKLVSEGNLTEEQCRKDANELFMRADNEEEWKMTKTFLYSKYGKEIAEEIVMEVER